MVSEGVSTNERKPGDESACDPKLWSLDPGIDFLNHGSFGSCPRVVLEFQQALRARMERQPVQYFVRDLEPMLDAARGELAGFLGADTEDLVFVPNATTGVNSVLRSLRFESGDELLVTDHEYNACRNALGFVAEQSGARMVMAHVPFPLQSAREIRPVLPVAVIHVNDPLIHRSWRSCSSSPTQDDSTPCA